MAILRYVARATVEVEASPLQTHEIKKLIRTTLRTNGELPGAKTHVHDVELEAIVCTTCPLVNEAAVASPDCIAECSHHLVQQAEKTSCQCVEELSTFEDDETEKIIRFWV